MREIGVVKWFDGDKGYGFISRIDEFEDLFVHVSQLVCSESSINEGIFVTYKISSQKKRQAIEVKLLKDENDLNVMKKAFISNRNGIWQHGFKKYVPTIQEPDEYIINLISTKLNSVTSNSSLLDYIPDKLFSYSQPLRRFLTPRKSLQLLINKITNADSLENNDSNIEELKKIMTSTESKNDWELITDDLLSDKRLREIAPKERILPYFINCLKKVNCEASILTECFYFLKKHKGFIEQVPKGLLLQYEELFTLLPPHEQVEIAWTDLERKWEMLSDIAKLMAIYKSAKNNDKELPIINKLRGYQETNLLVRAFMLVLSTKDYMEGYRNKGVEPFKIAHEMIQDYFISCIDYNITEISIIVPNCYHNETYLCEGRIWFETNLDTTKKKSDNFGNEIAFCSRRAGACIVDDKGARLYSNTNKDWRFWTLTELLDECGIEAKLPELQHNDMYIMKLNGWINRLIEIKEHMKCSVCKETLISDMRYAKNLAVYNSTVAKCRHNHETVYLTHCWACHKIIDSRVSIHTINGFHICIHCGSGPKANVNDTFSQGDLCPKCYSSGMQLVAYRIKECTTCHHKIKLPLVKYITGVPEGHGEYWSFS